MLPLVYTLSLNSHSCELQKRHGSCCYTRTQQTNALSSTPRKVKLAITDIRSSVVDADIHASRITDTKSCTKREGFVSGGVGIHIECFAVGSGPAVEVVSVITSEHS